MASTSIVQYDPSSSSLGYSHEVFISFSGEDTRRNFTDHLYEALVSKGINTFRDDPNLEQGKPISTELMNAIMTSRVAVVVLSQNYASSTWCLEELALIVECMKERGMEVFPIFYHVEPRDVRHQKGTFAVAFAKHEKRLEEDKPKVQRWRDALTAVVSLAGYDLQNRYESQLIKELVAKIFNYLRAPTHERPFETNLVGIVDRVEQLKRCMDMASNGVHFIGVSGISGIGKTTLAQATFERINHLFEARSFLRDVKNSHIDKLHRQLLRDIWGKETKVSTEADAINIIGSRLRSKKVLIVLDDVEREKWDKLARDSDWFGPGSRIILTTEDENLLLTKCKKKNLYKVKKLNSTEALKLFRQQVFPPSDHEKFLAEDVYNDFLSYADGHPLSLKMLGSHLTNKNTQVWKEKLEELRKYPDEKIKETLAMSYHGLTLPQKELFLAIAYFFNGETRDRVEDMLVGSHGIKGYHIDELIEKSIITNFGGKLWMHNALQEIGQQINRQIVEEHKWSRPIRLLDWQEFSTILKDNTGTSLVEGTMLNLLPHEEVSLNANTFSMMKDLRVLKICNVQLPQGLDYLPSELCLVDWHQYPLKSLPMTFKPEKLIELIMHSSRIKELPKQFNNLDKLKLLDFSDSKYLVRTPEFSGLPNLKKLIFRGCARLYKVDRSIGDHQNLVLLDLKDCTSLNYLPDKINMKSLVTFILSGCSKLKMFPEIGQDMTHLSALYLDGTAIEELPSSAEHLTGLTLLNLQDCKNFLSFPNVCSPVLSGIAPIAILVSNCFIVAPCLEPQHSLFLSGLSLLVSLNLCGCDLKDGALPDDLSCLSSLQSLNLSRNNFTRLPNSFSQLPKLTHLYLESCCRLKSLPNLPLSIEFVLARDCNSLENCSNQVIVWTSGEAGFTFIDCLNMADDEERKESMPFLQAKHFQPLWQRYLEKQIDQSEIFYSILPQTKIPKWFEDRKPESTKITKWFGDRKPGSPVAIQLPNELYKDSNWKGIALCTVFAVDKNSDIAPSGESSSNFYEFKCRLDIDGGFVDSPLEFNIPKDKLSSDSFGLWLYISDKRFMYHLDERNCISPSITTTSPGVEIKEFDARLLYNGDVEKFVQSLSQEHFQSQVDLSQYCENSISKPTVYQQCRVDEAETSKSIAKSNCNARLRVELGALLSILYQGCYAKNHWYDYLFPRIWIPSWFSYQNFFSNIRMRLPPDLHNNTRWMGFAVCAFYTINKKPVDPSLDSNLRLIFCGLSAGDGGPYGHCMSFPLSRDIFKGTKRLLVFYIPRVLLQFNQCSEILASFKSDSPNAKVEMCGINILYENNMGEFVKVLVECILESPELYHEHYLRNLLGQISMSQGCDHGEHSGCSFSSQRLLESGKNEAEDFPSLDAFSNQEIAEGTSGSSKSSIYLGIPFWNGQGESTSSISIPEDEVTAYLQNFHKNGTRDFSHCFPQSEIPEWFRGNRGSPQCFCCQSDGSSVRISLPPHMYDDSHWKGFAVCAVFSFHKHPTAVRNKLNDKVAHNFTCHLQTDLVSTLCRSSITEDEVLVSLCRRSFIWVLFIKRELLSHHWSQSHWAVFSFLGDSPDLSPQQCGVRLVYQQDMEDFNHALVGLVKSYIRYLKDIRDTRGSTEDIAFCDLLPLYRGSLGGSNNSCEDPEVQQLPFYVEETIGRAKHSYDDLNFHKHFFQTGPLDFHPSFYYNFCFPPSKTTQEWFSHESSGHTVTIDIPTNLYGDNNWLGLAQYACFSVHGDSEALMKRWVSETKHFVYCQFGMRGSDFDDEILGSYTSKVERVWLFNLGHFIWISYVPGEIFKSMLRWCSQIEASFVSEMPNLTVENCGICFIDRHNQLQFQQKLNHCNTLINEHEKYNNELLACPEKLNQEYPQNVVDSDTCKFVSFGGPNVQVRINLLDFDRCCVFNLCFRPRAVRDWFRHWSNGASLTIIVPRDDSGTGTMGLLLCAYFTIQEHQSATLEKFSTISPQLLCVFESNVAGTEPECHFHDISAEELNRLCTPDGFLWLSYIPLGSFPDWLNQCSCLQATFCSNWPDLTVEKCGLRFFHVHDEEELEKVIHGGIVFYASQHLISQPGALLDEYGQKEDSDQCIVYTSCFPRTEILDWFNHQSDVPTVIITPPPNLSNDHTWMGLALCVYFSVHKHPMGRVNNLDSQSPNLRLCHSEGIEPSHTHFFSEEDLLLLQLDGFIWLSHIPHDWFSNWLNQSNRIEASIVANYPGLTVQKCGFRFLYHNDQIEWKKTIGHCENALIEIRDVLHRVEETIKPAPYEDKGKSSSSNKSNEDSSLERSRASPDSRPKDKGKRIIE